MDPSDLQQALNSISIFSSEHNFSQRIADIEFEAKHKSLDEIGNFLTLQGINDTMLESAVKIKEAAGRINEIIHAVGILVSLKYILEPKEKILYLSLGAGNTGRQFDLETNKRIAEFKFIKWQGGAESIRQNSLFKDLFYLVEQKSDKKSFLYVLGKQYPLNFLRGDRNLKSVLSKNRSLSDRFFNKYGNKYSCVSEYYDDVKEKIEIIDLTKIVPIFGKINKK